MENYEFFYHSQKQANDFLRKTNTKIEKRFVKTGYYFPSDEDERDIWEIKLTRGTREYAFIFGDSIKNTNERLVRYDTQRERNIQEKDLKKWKSRPINENLKPSNYDILSNLEGYFYYEDVDSFSEDFGYTKPSVALRTYKACKKQSDELQKLYNDKELEALSLIQ